MSAQPSKSNLDFVIKAAAFAAQKHRDQRRIDREASPYINHPLALTYVLTHEGGVSDTITLVAALLHDTVEDTDTTPEEILDIFGPDVAAVVAEVTDDKCQPKAVRKQAQIDHAPHSSQRAKQVKLADKICNLRDLLASPPYDWEVSRIREYFIWSEAVVAGLRGTNPQLEAILDDLFARKP